MTRALLDTNVLIALLDPVHIHHNVAHSWFAGLSGSGWATCPITQNGYVRIVSQPSYPNSMPAFAAATLLRDFVSHPEHKFWADSISLLDESRCAFDRLASSRQVTDTYLLALAKANDGILITLDAKLTTVAVDGGKQHLFLLS